MVGQHPSQYRMLITRNVKDLSLLLIIVEGSTQLQSIHHSGSDTQDLTLQCKNTSMDIVIVNVHYAGGDMGLQCLNFSDQSTIDFIERISNCIDYHPTYILASMERGIFTCLQRHCFRKNKCTLPYELHCQIQVNYYCMQGLFSIFCLTLYFRNRKSRYIWFYCVRYWFVAWTE